MDIRGANPCSGDGCDQYGVPTSYLGDQIFRINSDTNIRCQFSSLVYYDWTVYRVDETATDMSTYNATVNNFTFTERAVANIPSNQLTGLYLRILTLDTTYFTYGLYRYEKN